MRTWMLFPLAVVFLILIPFTPQLVRLRIRTLRWIHWSWAANLLESHFQGWVVFVRVLLVVIATALFYIAWTQ